MNKQQVLESFKPYYKWITFNTKEVFDKNASYLVLNLIINGLPSIQKAIKGVYMPVSMEF